jgi:hypothetical protein
LESAEPLDWNRTELKLLFANRLYTIEEVDNLVKIIDGSVENIGIPREIRISYNNQWIDILVLETTDLSGYTVEYLPISAGEEEPYQEYYRFPENSLYLAGTLIRVYNGSEPTSDDETEHINLYADHQTGTLDAAGTLIGLKMRMVDHYTRDRSSRMPGSMNWIQILLEIRTALGRSFLSEAEMPNSVNWVMEFIA